MRVRNPAALVVVAGVSAALHVGKLPPALPVLREAVGLSLVEAGFLLSMVQLAGMALGLAVGLLADSLGLKRTVVFGLATLSVASVAGAFAMDAPGLLAWRAVEGFGFLLASLPAPALIRRLVSPQGLSRLLGWWGAYMPLGTAMALLAGPAVIAAFGWPAWWCLLGALSMSMAVCLWLVIPAACDQPHPDAAASGHGRVRETLTHAGPWLVAGAFAVYSAQWLSIIGFLPSIYAQTGVAGPWAAFATAIAALVNMVGNIAAGRLLHRGFRVHRLLQCGYAAMGLGAVLAFSPIADSLGPTSGAVLRYGGVVLFSVMGGLVPGTLFSVAVQVAPSERTVGATVGWMQQASATGQFLGPPAVAWLAGLAGSWSWTWAATGGCALAGMLLAQLLPQRRSASSSSLRSR